MINKTTNKKVADEIWAWLISHNVFTHKVSSEDEKILYAGLSAYTIGKIKEITHVEELEVDEILKICDYCETICFQLKKENISRSMAETHNMIDSLVD
jgi:hypothetical protein